MKMQMDSYFQRLLASWKAREGTLPKVAVIGDEDRSIYEGEPDQYGYIQWRPKEKTTLTDLRPIEHAMEKLLHPSIHEYLNSYWFGSMEGKYNGLGITLMPVLPGLELEWFLRRLVGYKEAHDDRLDHVPIGSEFNGGLVVIHNATGEVQLEDYERGTFKTIAPRLETLIADLRL